MSFKHHSLLILLALVVHILGGCVSGTNFAVTSAGGFSGGVTPGGAQDIGLARQLITSGQVPREDAFQVEGLYAEHDLPLGDAPAGATLHLNLGLGITPSLREAKPAYFVQVALSSGLSKAQVHRPPLHLAVVADRSGSMGGAKIESLRMALKQLVDQLTEQDRLALILFDDRVDLVRELSPVKDKASLKGMINRIEVRGATDIEAGLRRGYEILRQSPCPEGYDRRVLLFTDALPNTGRTDAESFTGVVSRNAADGIGLTAFGIGLDFGASLAEIIGSQRGGNYVFLKDEEHVAKVFNEDFDYLVSPAAYDLNLQVTPAPGMRIAESFGAGTASRTSDGFSLKVPTVFFSRNRGAIVLRLEETATGSIQGVDQPLITGQLRYTERDRTTRREQSIEVRSGEVPLADLSRHFVPAQTRKAVALTKMYFAMREAARRYHAIPSDKDGARSILASAIEELKADRVALDDAALDPEIALLQKMADNCVN